MPEPDYFETLLQTACLVHIHAAMVGSNIGWQVLELLKACKQTATRTMLTMHDFQWLFPSCPFVVPCDPRVPSTVEAANTLELMELVDTVVMPSQRVYDVYALYLGQHAMPANKVHIQDHPDVPANHDLVFVPPVKGNMINLAFVGSFAPHKGSELFLEMASKIHGFDEHALSYHVFGPADVATIASVPANMTFHGSYENPTLATRLYDCNIHAVLMLSTAEETFCYSLNTVARSGLPILYLNHGAFRTRLPQSARYFAVNCCMCGIPHALNRLCQFVMQKQGLPANQPLATAQAYKVAPTPWYLSVYPNGTR
jgi:hypothetical protein